MNLVIIYVDKKCRSMIFFHSNILSYCLFRCLPERSSYFLFSWPVTGPSIRKVWCICSGSPLTSFRDENRQLSWMRDIKRSLQTKCVTMTPMKTTIAEATPQNDSVRLKTTIEEPMMSGLLEVKKGAAVQIWSDLITQRSSLYNRFCNHRSNHYLVLNDSNDDSANDGNYNNNNAD